MSKKASGKHYGCGQGGVKTPSLTINPLFDDGFSATSPADYYAPALLSGTARHVESGNYVSVTLNGETWQGLVDKNGEWSIPLPPSAITSLKTDDTNDTHDLVISVTNNHGKSATQTREVLVMDMLDGRAAGIAIGAIAGNDEVIGREKAHGQVISGLTERVAEGAMVTVTLEGHSWQVPVDANGAWSTVLTPEMMKNLSPGEHTLSVSVESISGDGISSDTRAFTVVKGNATRCAAEITINPISGDDMLTTGERASSLTISGTTVNVANGSQVWVQLGDEIYAATVKNNLWETQVPVDDLAQLKQGDATVIAWVKDLHETATDVRVFENFMSPQIILTPPYNNFVIDDTQWAMFAEELSGTVKNVQPGAQLHLLFGNTIYQPRVDAEGKWHQPIPVADLMTLEPGEIRLEIQVSRNYPPETARLEQTVTLEDIFSSPDPRLAIAPISTDDIINAQESQNDLIISGSSLNLPAGETVTITLPGALPGQTFTGKIGTYGDWSVTIPAEMLQNLAADKFTVNAETGGGTLTDSRSIEIFTGGDPEDTAVITIDSLRPGSAISQEDVAGYRLVISGSAENVANNSEVRIQLGHSLFMTTVRDGKWTLTVPYETELKNGPTTINVTVRDGEDTASAILPVNIVDRIPLKIDLLPGGDTVMHYDTPWDHIITGTIRNEGSPVTLTLNGKSYQAVVVANEWMVRIPGEDINALPAGSVPLNVKTGNFTTGITLTVNDETQTLPVRATLDAVSDDNLITYEEMGPRGGLYLSGGVSGAGVAAGTVVDVELNGSHYKTALAEVDGELRWSFVIPLEETKLLPMNGSRLITVTLDDFDQPSVVTARVLEFNRDANPSDYQPRIVIDTLSDNAIDQSEVDDTLIITGSTRYYAVGSTVIVEINEIPHQTTVDDDGRWQVAFPASDLATIPDGDYEIKARIPQDFDPTISVSEDYRPISFNTGNTAAQSVTVDAVTGDNFLTAEEVAAGVTLSGAAINFANGRRVDIDIEIGEGLHLYRSAYVQDQRWQIILTADELARLEKGWFLVTASVMNQYYDTIASDSVDVRYNPQDPGFTLDPAFGNATLAHYDEPYAHYLTGNTTYFYPGMVTATLNGKSYQASVTEGDWMLYIPGADINALPAGTLPLRLEWASYYDEPAAVIETTLTVKPDTVSHPFGATLDVVAGDNLVAAHEMFGGLTLSGGVLDASAAALGTPVTVEFYGKQYHTVLTGEASNPRWSLVIPAEVTDQLPTWGDQIITVTLGETGQQTIPASRLVEFTDEDSQSQYMPQIALYAVGDDLIDQSEIDAPLLISGNTRYVSPGLEIDITLNGMHWQTTNDNDGRWQVEIPASALEGIADGSYTLNAAFTLGEDGSDLEYTFEDWRTLTFDTDQAAAGELETLPLLAMSSIDNYSDMSELDLAATDEKTPLSTPDDLGLSGGKEAIAAMLASTDDKQVESVSAKDLTTPDAAEAGLTESRVALTPASEIWASIASRSEVDTSSYAPLHQSDLHELLAQQTSLA